jgi:hypothetical protein
VTSELAIEKLIKFSKPKDCTGNSPRNLVKFSKKKPESMAGRSKPTL